MRFTSRLTATLTMITAIWLSCFDFSSALPTPQAPTSHGNNKYHAHNYNPLTQQGNVFVPGKTFPGGVIGAYDLSKGSSTPPPAAVPEPASGILLGLGMAAAALARRRKKRSAE